MTARTTTSRAIDASVSRRVLCGFSAFFGACGCQPDPEPGNVVSITPYWPALCAPTDDSRRARFQLTALGDFDPSPTTAEALEERDDRARLVMPPTTQAVVIEAADGFSRWLGAGRIHENSGTLPVALLPAGETCMFFRPRMVPQAPLAQATFATRGEAFGWSPAAQRFLLTGGVSDQSSAVTSAVAIDASSGLARWVEGANGPRSRRAYGTVTEFGDALLVAGGENPFEDGAPLDNAEVFDPATVSFDPASIPLESARTHHAAVVLENGETLLIGGRDADGRVLRTLEAVSPETRRFRISRLASLSQARIDPSVHRLSDGRILVAGGEDQDGLPVRSLEWLAPDASRVVRVVSRPDLRPSRHRAYIPMSGGSILAVGGCELEPTVSISDCIATNSAFWIRADGTVDSLPPLDVDARFPALIAAGDGKPFLVADSVCGPGEISCTPRRVLRRFDPWSGRFLFPDRTPSTLPDARARVLAPDAGAFYWLTHGPIGEPIVNAYRHGTRGPFAQDTSPFVVANTDHLAPSLLPGSAIVYDEETRWLTLHDTTQSITVTDTTFATLELRVSVREEELSGFIAPPPLIHLGSLQVGGDACPWPETPRHPYVAQVSRDAESVRLTLGEEDTVTCASPEGRVAVRISAADAPLVIDSIRVRREL